MKMKRWEGSRTIKLFLRLRGNGWNEVSPAKKIKILMWRTTMPSIDNKCICWILSGANLVKIRFNRVLWLYFKTLTALHCSLKYLLFGHLCQWPKDNGFCAPIQWNACPLEISYAWLLVEEIKEFKHDSVTTMNHKFPPSCHNATKKATQHTIFSKEFDLRLFQQA